MGGEYIMDNFDPLNFSTEEEYYEYHDNNGHSELDSESYQQTEGEQNGKKRDYKD